MKKPFLFLFIMVMVFGLILVLIFVLSSNDEAVNQNANNNQNLNQSLDADEIASVYSPKAYESVKSPIEVSGIARGNWFFEASFPVKLISADGEILAETYATAKADWMTEEFVPFEASIVYSSDESIAGRIILEKANPSDLPQYANSIEVPVYLEKTNGQSSKVEVFFSSTDLNSQALDCSLVYPVERQVVKTPALAKAALVELIKGPTEDEVNLGYYSGINPETEIQSLVIENGTALVDFSQELQAGVAGSCMVTSIVAEITETLKQFSTVDEVVISIDGETESILQP